MLRKNKSRGFTLVELLVVIGIIALLISILLPALGKAKESARATKCAANIHSALLGLNMYANDYKGWLPKSRGNSTPRAAGIGEYDTSGINYYLEYSWTWTLAERKYVRPNFSFLCPKAFTRTRIADGDDPATSYKYHNFEGYLPAWDYTKRSSDGDNESNRSCYALRWGTYDPVTKRTIIPRATNKNTEFFFNRLSDLRPASDMFLVTESLSNSTILRHDYASADYTHTVYLRHGSKSSSVANTGFADGSVRGTPKEFWEKRDPTNNKYFDPKIWPGGVHTVVGGTSELPSGAPPATNNFRF